MLALDAALFALVDISGKHVPHGTIQNDTHAFLESGSNIFSYVYGFYVPQRTSILWVREMFFVEQIVYLCFG